MVNGIPTDFSLERFSDKTVVLITQIGRIGTYIACTLEDNGLIDGSTKSYQTVILLGPRNNPFAEICARQIHEHIRQFELGLNCAGNFGADIPSLLLGITLRAEEQTRECMHELITCVVNLYSRSVI